MSRSRHLSFHSTCGENIELLNSRKTAKCISSENTQRFAFSSRPIKPNEVINLKIKGAYIEYPITFGFTELNPSDIEDVDDFHELKEDSVTWTHDVKLTKSNSILSFSYNDSSDITYTNDDKSVTFPKRKIVPEYDQWALIYIRGKDTCVTMVTAEKVQQQQLQQLQPQRQQQQQQQQQQQRQERRESESSDRNETCNICFVNKIDSVIYRCGHACMCLTCAGTQWDGKAGSGTCPVCRSPIVDIIKLYV